MRGPFLQLEEHCCEEALEVTKYLQIGTGKGRQILVVAESPAGEGWRKSGRAFYTTEGKVLPTGKNLLEILKMIDSGLDLASISFTEIAKCYIANNRHKLESCAQKTWGLFLEQVKYVDPKLILLLGKKTMDIFNNLADCKAEIGNITEVNLASHEYPVLAVYHPSPANPRRLLNSDMITTNLSAIKKLLR
jgi:uracil-DNA glycosylase family 4